MDKIKPVVLELEKSEVDLTVAGVEQGKVIATDSHRTESVQFLPDILTFLQRETELSRGTLVEILKLSGRLTFALNVTTLTCE